MNFKEVSVQSAPPVGKRRFFLEGRDALWFGASAVITGAVIFTAQKLGLVDTYLESIESLSHIGEVSEQDLSKLLENPLILKQAAMGIGLITGVITDFIYSGEVLTRLLFPQKKVRLSGNHDYEVTETGVREGDTQCVDARIDAALQETVEPGAGHMGGWFLMFQAAAQGVHSLWGENIAADFLTGYLMGRALPTAAYSFVHTLATAEAQGLLGSFRGEGPLRVNHLPHKKGCGWTATVNAFLHDLKFNAKSPEAHSRKIERLDIINKLPQFVNTAAWEPMMNVLAVPLSLGTYIINPNFGTQELTPEKHHS